MKRLTLLAVALVMVLGMAVSAAAAPEVTVSGNLMVNALWTDNWDFQSRNDNSNVEQFRVYERADLYFTAVANENLKGVLGFRSLRGEWGEGAFADGAPGGAGSATIGIREAYVDFNWPGTSVNVKAGIQNVGLPAAVGGGSIIQNEKMGAVMVSTSFTDNVGLLVGWGRIANRNDTVTGPGASTVVSNAGNQTSEIDAAILALPLTFEGFNMTPYAAYAITGKDANATAGLGTLNSTNNAANYELENAWWIGTDFTMNLFDPFILKADLAYGQANGKGNGNDRAGWLFDAALEYTGWDFMTPELFFVYTSGEDGNASKGDGDSERLPVIAGDWTVGSFFFGGGSVTGDDMSSEANQNGFWTVGLSLRDIQSFAEGLTHTAHILYAQGTNDKDSIVDNTFGNASYNSVAYGRMLTEKESLWEVDFNTDYQIYDELTLYNQIGYINLDADQTRRGAGLKGGDAWKFGIGVVYQF